MESIDDVVEIFVVEDHPVMRLSIRALLAREVDMDVCGEAATAEIAMDQLSMQTPDLVLIDVSLPGMSGIELVRVLQQQHPNLRLVMLSGHNERRHVEQALKAGATGYILKGNGNELPVAIRQVMRNEEYVSPEIFD